MIASTADDGDDWSLGIMKSDKDEYVFLVMNNKDFAQGAVIPYNRNSYDFYLDKSPFVFMMAVAGSPKDVDNDLGEWRDDMHLLPVYALYSYENGQVKLDGYLSSCQGLSSSHYQGRINSPYHIKIAETFLTKMPALHKVVDSNGIKLP